MEWLLQLAWVVTRKVVDLFYSWGIVKKNQQIVAMQKMVPTCLVWCIYKEGNNRNIEGCEQMIEELKTSFFNIFYLWTAFMDFNGLTSRYFLVSFSASRWAAYTMCTWNLGSISSSLIKF